MPALLTDSYKREFHYLRLSITDVCNFRCNYCLPDGYECDSSREFLTPAEIKRVVKAFTELGTSKIRITGGEPGLRKDLTEIIDTVKNVEGVRKLALTTNGFNLTKNINDWADAGLDQLNVSIDSLHPDSFRMITGSNKLQEILTGIDQALELGLKVKVNAVMLKQCNGQQLGDFLNWLKTTPITLRFIELMRTGDNKEFFDAQHIRGSDVMADIEKQGWMPLLKTKDAGPAQEFQHPDYQGRLGFILPYSKDFCATCNRLRVSATANLHKCLFAEEGQNFRHLLQTDQQKEELKVWLQQQLTDKKETHGLHLDNPGATKHLAMLGG